MQNPLLLPDFAINGLVLTAEFDSFILEYVPAAVPPQSSSGSVLYLSPSLFLLKLASQGIYPGTVVGIELTQRLAWEREQKASIGNKIKE